MSPPLTEKPPRDQAGTATARGSRSPAITYAWVVVGLLWVVACLNYLDRLMLVSMRESVKADIAMTEAQFGLLTSVFLWVYGALSPLGGFLADRFGRKWVIIGSLGTWSVMTWLTGHVHTFQGLFVARALMGVSEACYIPAGLALIAEWHHRSTRSLATGIHMSGLYTGAALGGLGGYVADSFGWRQGFTWFGLIGIAYSVVLLACLRGGSPGQSADVVQPLKEADKCRWSEALRGLFGQRSFYALLTYLSLAALAAWGITGWLPTFLREQFSLTQGKAGLAATGYVQFGSYLGVLAGGAWSDRWVQRTPRARLYIVLIGFCLGGPSLCLMAGTPAFAWAIVGMLLYGVARGFSDANVMPILCQVASPKYRATGYGFLNLFSTFTGGAMIYAGGVLRDAHVNLAKVFQASAIALVIAGLVLLAVRPSTSKEEG
jgi:MFS transporter, Spinster family, sphingosine-1-phosphate transporter